MQPTEQDIFQFGGNNEDFEILAEDHIISKPQDIYFDQIVAALQEIILDDNFQHLQTAFMKQHCHIFQPVEENKIEYMTIFNSYQQSVEVFIEKKLQQMVPGFKMETFSELLKDRHQQIDQQILDMLQSFTDFQVFKQLILDYKLYYEKECEMESFTLRSKHNAIKMEGKKQLQNGFLMPDMIITVKPLRKNK